MSGSLYTNPVCHDALGDPFVLKHNGCWYAYGTQADGRGGIPVFRSDDLVTWERVGLALAPPADAGPCCWAPEVAYADGRFFLYYSAGGPEGEGHSLRVAESVLPDGPFEDRGELYPGAGFTIDPHPFRDSDGSWYLFHCRDFLDGERVGTGIVVDRLRTMTEAEGDPVVVVRPYAEWNVFQRRRRWAGREDDWYTLEGACARRHDGRLYLLFSGGAWREPNYGVDWCVADVPTGPWSSTGGEQAPRVLASTPGAIGPGHCSIARGPDDVQEYLVYHAWRDAGDRRQMRIDPLVWSAAGPLCPGPSTEPRPAPAEPAFRSRVRGPQGAALRSCAWHVDGRVWSAAAEREEVVARLCAVAPSEEVVASVSLAPGSLGGDAFAGVRLESDAGRAEVGAVRDGLTALWQAGHRGAGGARVSALPADGFVHLRVWASPSRLHVEADGALLADIATPHLGRLRMSLVSRSCEPRFAGAALTVPAA